MSAKLDLVQTFFRGIESGDLDLCASCCTDDIVTENPYGVLHGIAEFRGLGEAFVRAVPDMRLAIRRTYETDDAIVVEGVYSGTQTGPLATPGGDIPPTGRAFSFPFLEVYVVQDGKFTEHRGYWDNVTFMTQLGLIPEPASA